MSEMIVRPLRADDAHAAGLVVDSALARTRYHERVRELLASALGFDDDEHLGLVAAPARGSEGTSAPDAHGLALFGRVAGAAGVMRVHALLDTGGALLGALLREVVIASAATHTRLIVCELPEDTPFEPLGHTLAEAGFVEEGRIEDLVAEGVAMRFLVRRAASPSAP